MVQCEHCAYYYCLHLAELYGEGAVVPISSCSPKTEKWVYWGGVFIFIVTFVGIVSIG